MYTNAISFSYAPSVCVCVCKYTVKPKIIQTPNIIFFFTSDTIDHLCKWGCSKIKLTVTYYTNTMKNLEPKMLFW